MAMHRMFVQTRTLSGGLAFCKYIIIYGIYVDTAAVQGHEDARRRSHSVASAHIPFCGAATDDNLCLRTSVSVYLHMCFMNAVSLFCIPSK